MTRSVIKTERDGYWYKDSSNQIRFVKTSKNKEDVLSMKDIARVTGGDIRFLITTKNKSSL